MVTLVARYGPRYAQSFSLGNRSAHPENTGRANIVRAEVRRRLVAVRLTATEQHAWGVACTASPWQQRAAWARAVVDDALRRQGPGERPGAIPKRTDVDEDLVAAITASCSTLNAVVRDSHRLGRLLPGAEERATAVGSLAILSERQTRAAHPSTLNDSTRAHYVARDERQKHLVNIRLSDAELQGWSEAALQDGHPRVSSWTRALIGELVGLSVPQPVAHQSLATATVRRSLGGALNNVTQLVELARETRDSRQEILTREHERLQATMIAFASPTGGHATSESGRRR